MTKIPDLSRRRFLKTSSLAVAGAATVRDFPFIHTRAAASDEMVRVGIVGCGGRGTGAMLNVLGAGTQVIYPRSGYHTEDVAEDATVDAQNVQITALADLFEDRLNQCRTQLRKLDLDVADDAVYTGFDAYKQLLARDDVDYVLLTTPPHFRPAHLKAAVEAGKHVFMEKPVAVDVPGVRMVMEAGKVAKQKGLGIIAGTQRRHDRGYEQTVARLQDGAIGDIHTVRAYWNGGVIWSVAREPGWSDMEWQVRNWNYFNWLSGDHIVEQHVHNLDVANWVLGMHPISARGLGGRQARPDDPKFGHIYDHFAVEYEYPNGARMYSQCRQIDGCDNLVGEEAVGSKGFSNCHSWIRGENTWRFDGETTNPYEQEHINLINSIRRGEPLNEAQSVAESTLTGIMGRESAYSGRTITWEEAMESVKRLGPDEYVFGDLPFPDVPVPGEYQFS